MESTKQSLAKMNLIYAILLVMMVLSTFILES